MVRESMNDLLGIKLDKEIVAAVNNGHELTPEEHAAYEQHGTKLKVIEDLSVNCLKPFWKKIDCEYNRVLAALFTYHFIATNSTLTKDHDVIADHFLRRLRRLKTFLH